MDFRSRTPSYLVAQFANSFTNDRDYDENMAKIRPALYSALLLKLKWVSTKLEQDGFQNIKAAVLFREVFEGMGYTNIKGNKNIIELFSEQIVNIEKVVRNDPDMDLKQAVSFCRKMTFVFCSLGVDVEAKPQLVKKSVGQN